MKKPETLPEEIKPITDVYHVENKGGSADNLMLVIWFVAGILIVVLMISHLL